jgi:putative heme degradation protein
MTSGAVGVWEQAVRALQEMTKDPASLNQFDAVSALGVKLRLLPPPPKAAWKKLVQQLQVSDEATTPQQQQQQQQHQQQQQQCTDADVE